MERVAAVVTRGGIEESWHRASVAVVDPRGAVVGSFGDAGLVSFLRSAAKPFQAAVVVESGAAHAFGLSSRDLALIAGSHNGEDIHVDGVKRLLGKVGLEESDLQCGRHAPFHKPTARRLAGGHSTLHHNCSGKHAGMLAVATHLDLDLASYLGAGHGVQTRIRRLLAEAASMPPTDVAVAVDGCGAPTFAMSVGSAGRAAAVMMAAPAGHPLAVVRDAMMAHPELVAGDDRIDTRLMRAAPGRLLIKAGAEAFYIMGLAHGKLGVAIKVEDGEARAMGPIIGAVLAKFSEEDAPALEGVDDLLRPVLRNHAGRDVGQIEATMKWVV